MKFLKFHWVTIVILLYLIVFNRNMALRVIMLWFVYGKYKLLIQIHNGGQRPYKWNCKCRVTKKNLHETRKRNWIVHYESHTKHSVSQKQQRWCRANLHSNDFLQNFVRLWRNFSFGEKFVDGNYNQLSSKNILHLVHSETTCL